jgi:flagellar biogenesis protein FliO
MTRARKLASWPLLGVVLVVGVAFGLSSVGTRVAAEEPAEVGAADGVITPAPPMTETARPVVKNSAAQRAGVLEPRAPRAVTPRAVQPTADRKAPLEATSIRPPTAQGDLASPAPINSLAGVGLKLLLGSLVLAALLYGAARWLKRMPFARFLPGTDGPIKVIGRTHLGSKASLCLVEVGSTTLLVSMTGTAIQTLHVWPDGVTGAMSADRQSFKVSAASAPVAGQLRNLESRLTGRNG